MKKIVKVKDLNPGDIVLVRARPLVPNYRFLPALIQVSHHDFFGIGAHVLDCATAISDKNLIDFTLTKLYFSDYHDEFEIVERASEGKSTLVEPAE